MIEIEDLWRSFDGGATWAVRDVALDVPEGELLCLVGESGSGKTTTLRCVNRLEEPDRGTVRVGGRDVRDVDPVELRRGIGWVIQGVGLLPHRSVAENVALVPRLLGLDAAETRRRVDEHLALVGLEPERFRDRAPRELSGGQAQRVGVARALAGRPAVLLLDEPFGALDAVTRAELQEEFQALRRRLGVTAILVTHDVAEALLLGDRVAVLREGAVVASGTPAELLADAGDPYAREVLAAPRRQARRIAELGP